MYKEIPIETKIREILDVLEGRQYISFNEILKLQKSRMDLIVCFMAVLELVKNRQIAAKQSDQFEDIRIYKVYNEIDPEEKNETESFDFLEEKNYEEQTPAPDLELTGADETEITKDRGEEDGNI